MTPEEFKEFQIVANKFKKQILGIMPGVFAAGGLIYIEGKPALRVICTESARKEILKKFGENYLGYTINFNVGGGTFFGRKNKGLVE